MVVTCAVGLAVGTRLRDIDDSALDAKVRSYILRHPEVLSQAATKLALAPYRKAIERPFAGAWAGNPKGDVTLVVFTDYNCPYCRATSPELDRLLANDPQLKVVWREMPVLGPGSEKAAATALAAAQGGKYLAFHRALFAGGHPDEDGLVAAAKVVHISPDRLAAGARTPDVQAELQTNLALGQQLAIAATPFFIVGNRTIQGAVGYDRLAAAVAEARRDAQ
jgi:protein-disulfide isomerase